MFSTILAVEEVARTGAVLPTQFPQQADVLAWSQQMSPGLAALLIMLGVVYLLFGWQIFKALVMLNAAVLGGYLGYQLGTDGERALVFCVIGAAGAAALTWPTMKYAVALMGGVFGALLGASIWHTARLDPQLVWAGAMVGLVGFGLFSFVLFRGSVMMYTSLQGAFMLVFGILGLIDKYQEIGPRLLSHLSVRPFILPSAIFIPMVAGLIFQQHHTATHGSGGGKGKN